jgi:hypothetical protein
MLVLILAWYYHQRILEQDAKIVPVEGGSAVIRRLYIYAFCAAGLAMMSMAVINLLQWLMSQFGGGVVSSGRGYLSEIARLIVGLPVWVIFWRWAQRLFFGEDVEERESALRKFYLYLIIFIAVLSSVTSATFILEGITRRLLVIPQLGASEGDIRVPISIIITMAIMWVYHSNVIKVDIKLAGEARRQAAFRRLYFYLIAAIGLSAFLVGISGILSVLIRSLDQTTFGFGLKQQLAWFISVSIAGLPVFYLPWRQAQKRAATPGMDGAGERRSVVRRLYLYFFLFVAAMTVLSSIIYIVFRLISMLLGEDSPTLSELGQPFAYSIIAGVVWAYHWSILRGSRQLMLEEQVTEHEEFSIVIAGVGDKDFSQTLMAELERKNLGASLVPVDFTETEAEPREPEELEEITNQLNQAGLIIGAWEISMARRVGSAISPKLTKAVIDSPATKLLLPKRFNEWQWAGVEPWSNEYYVRHTINAVEQILEGEDVRLSKPLGVGAIIGIIIGVLLLLILLGIPLLYFFAY